MRTILKLLLAALLGAQARAYTLELSIENGILGGVPIDSLRLHADSEDGIRWQLGGKLPAIRIAGSPLKNTVLQAALRRSGHDLYLENLSLRGRRGKSTLVLSSGRLVLQNLLRGELQLPLQATLNLRADNERLQAVLTPVGGGADIRAELPLLLVQTLAEAENISLGGILRPQLQLRRGSDGLHIDGDIILDKLRYNSVDGLQAGKNLDGSIRLALRQNSNGWQGDIRLQLQKGEILLSPLYLKLDGAPLTARSQIDWQPPRLRLTGLHLEDAHSSASADLEWNNAEKRLTALNLHHLDGDADHLYRRYLKPVLGDSLFGDARLQGSLYLHGNYRDGTYRDLAAVLNHIHIEDAQGRYRLQDLDGQLGDNGEPSRLSIQSARWLKLPLGATRAELRWNADGINLEKSLHLPVLDGGIILHRFTPDGSGYKISAQIAPVSLRLLGEALDLPRFSGMISGTLPDVRLNRDGLQLQQPVNVAIFNGNIQIEKLHISRFFSDTPYAGFDLNLRTIDLEQLTQAFGIGEIEGHLEGRVENVALARWRPQRFNARLQTAAENPGKRRISHEAVAYLSRAGGDSGIMVNQFIRMLNRFPYDKLGFSARLENGVLHLDGIAPAEDGNGGYYLVKGRGAPRLDIIGHTHKIDWEELLNRLKNAGNSEGAHIESKLGQ